MNHLRKKKKTKLLDIWTYGFALFIFQLLSIMTQQAGLKILNTMNASTRYGGCALRKYKKHESWCSDIYNIFSEF